MPRVRNLSVQVNNCFVQVTEALGLYSGLEPDTTPFKEVLYLMS